MTHDTGIEQRGTDAAGPFACAEVRRAAEATRTPLMVLDGEGRIRHANGAAGRLFGFHPRSLSGRLVADLVHRDDVGRLTADLGAGIRGEGLGKPCEYRVGAPDGSWRTVAAVASKWPVGGAALLVRVVDITDLVERTASLRGPDGAGAAPGAGHQSLDPVTGLPDRDALLRHVRALLTDDAPLSVAVIDLEECRRVHECLGHPFGDMALQVAAARLTSFAPPGALVAHVGAGAFVVTLAADCTAGVAALEQLLAYLREPATIAGLDVVLAGSAGIVARHPGASGGSLLRDATTAAARAKARRPGCVQVFTEDLRRQALHRLALEVDLHRAIERDELRLHLQPIVDLHDRSIACHEALIRWTHDGVVIPPSTFIPVAERTDEIRAIGAWTLRRGLDAVRAGKATCVGINLSPSQLLDPALPDVVGGLLADGDVAARCLNLEITEDVVIEQFDRVSETLGHLRALGCRVGLDDFGVGYSSLGYLRRLPIDFIKFDRSLVTDVDTDPQAAKILTTTVILAKSLSLLTIAEGVEKAGQAHAVSAMGCDYGQGWFFGRPAPV